MTDRLAQFCGTVRIDAAMVGFALRANDMAATYRALLRHVKYLAAARMILVFNDADYFRNHVPAALNLYPIADLHAEALDLVHVVKRRARYGRAADRDRLQRSDRREFARFVQPAPGCLRFA